MQKTNTFWILTTLVAIVIGTGGYAVLASQGVVPPLQTFSMIAPADSTHTEEPTTPEPTPPKVVEVEAPKTTPTVTPTTSAYLDVKDVYDTTVYPGPRSDNLSGTKRITVRARLDVIQAEGLCQTKPCPQPDTSNYRFALQDVYEKQYSISVHKTGDPVVKDLTDAQVYVIRGTLNYSFSSTGKPTFTFDPESVIE
jgi:hypothetical protein